MNKKQVLQKSQKLGSEISDLIHEFRNSSGQDVNCEDFEYEDFFAGVILFLCTGRGSVQLDCDPSPKYNLIDGSISHTDDSHHPLPEDKIYLEHAVAEKRFYKDGEIRTSYTITMDPTTYVNYFTHTGFFGPPIRNGVKKNEEV